jgi:hypothetical protein
LTKGLYIPAHGEVYRGYVFPYCSGYSRGVGSLNSIYIINMQKKNINTTLKNGFLHVVYDINC